MSVPRPMARIAERVLPDKALLCPKGWLSAVESRIEPLDFFVDDKTIRVVALGLSIN